MDQSLSKNWDFKIISEFSGYNSTRDATNISPDVFVRGSQNVYKKLSGTIAVRQGQKRRGAINGAYSAISSEFVWNTSWGAVLPLIVANNKLQVEYNGVMIDLLTGLTKTRYVFDKWWNNTDKKDEVLFVKGDSDIQSWTGGIATVASGTVNTITKTDPSISWRQAGFTPTGTKKLTINGVEYTYTGGEDTAILTGVTPDASGLINGDIALQSVVTHVNNPAVGFNADFIKVINNQAYVGSYTSRLCYISSNTDYTNYVVPSPRLAGSPELLTLDSTLKGIGVRQGSAHIGYGSGEWAIITFTDVTVGTTLTQKTTVDIKPVSKQGAPYAHEFIANSGDNIIYLSQDQQVRSFGDFNLLFTSGYPSLSQEINTELAEENFTGGALKCIGDFTYLTAPASGKVYLYQVRQSVDANGQVVAERLWHAPFIWNITRVDEISGIIYGFSNANPQIYQLWDTGQWYDDSPSDEHLPYTCILAFGYRNGGRRQGLISFDKNFSEGYITTGVTLNLAINYNYQGSLSRIDAIVNSIIQPGYTFGSNYGSLGDSILGDKILGDEIQESNYNDLVKFKVINSLNIQNIFEYQPIYYSDSADAQWEILATGTNMHLEADEQSNFLINKKR